MNWLSRICLVAAMLLTVAATHAQNSYVSTFPDRASPEALITTFMNATDGIAARLEALEAARRDSQSSFYPQPSRHELSEINMLKDQAVESLDLSRVPEAIRQSEGIEAALMLREVLRMSGYGQVPLKVRQLKDDLWVIEGTYIHIGVLEDGPSSGDHVFTRQTVAYAPSLYESVIGKKPADEFNAYVYYIETPGGVVPPVWAGLVMKLPKMWRQIYAGNTLWQWSAFALCLALLAFVPRTLSRMAKVGTKRHAVFAASMAVVAACSGYLLIQEVNLTGTAQFICLIIFNHAFYLSLAACVFMVSEWLADNVSRVSKLDPANFDSSMIRLFCRVLGITGAIAVLAFGASRAGIPVMGIIAGLGVGGLAVALAAQPTIENLLAGIVLYLDGSIRVGERIEAKEVEGVIEQIGMRSTRVRSPDGAIISITNSDLASRIVKNHSRKAANKPGKKNSRRRVPA